MLTVQAASGLTDDEAAVAEYHWPLWARPEQLEPAGDWTVWLVLAGRGYGKTRMGAEWVRGLVHCGVSRIGLIAPTAADARDILVEGESGILACSPPWDRPHYEPSKRRIAWDNGAMATVFSADEPDRLRGPQYQAIWCDELAAWKRLEEAWDNAMLGLRLGDRPRAMITTTPKPRAKLKEIMESRNTVVTRGTTYENLANLAPVFREQILDLYAGTRLGRQEIEGLYLEDVPGALWSREMIRYGKLERLERVVVAIDPAVTSGDGSDDTGIVVVGRTGQQYLVLADRTCHLSPRQWADVAVGAYYEFEADRIIGEVNNGGDMVEAVIRQIDDQVPYRAVRASRGKRARAEPIAALYEQGKVLHARPMPALEDQMVSFTPDTKESPDRVDALVWGLSELSGHRREIRLLA